MKMDLRWAPSGAVATTAPFSKRTVTLLTGSKPPWARAAKVTAHTASQALRRFMRTPGTFHSARAGLGIQEWDAEGHPAVPGWGEPFSWAGNSRFDPGPGGRIGFRRLRGWTI